MRSYANVLGPYSIRCNTVHPTGVNTPMLANEAFAQFAVEEPSMLEAMHNTLPVPMIEAIDVSNTIVYLCSEAADS